MNSGKVFAAPWSGSLKLITLLSVGVLLSIPVFGMDNFYDGMEPALVFTLFVFPVAIVVIAVFFIIRNYEISNDVLYIQRFGWRTTLDLTGLESAETDPQAMKGSIRTFGNGGLFCFAGRFRNKKLGAYRAFATDPKLAVVLTFPDKVVVVTPKNPANFSMMLKPATRLKSGTHHGSS